MILAAIAIPIAIVVTLVRRIQQVARRLNDPTRLQQVFAESAAAALHRAEVDSRAVAKLEVPGMGAPRPPEPARAPFEPARALQRPRRPRRQAPANRGGGLDMGDQFRLAVPPELNEPRGPVAFANWLAVALFAAAVTGYFLL